jgi:uncharacterized protein YsxB (DUF464 family)
MISVEVRVDNTGVLCGCSVRGHSGYASAGRDIVCAAVSVLARSLARALATERTVHVHWNAPQRGAFDLDASAESAGREFLRAAGCFFIEGVRSVAEEFPAACAVTTREP